MFLCIGPALELESSGCRGPSTQANKSGSKSLPGGGGGGGGGVKREIKFK